MTPSDFLVQVLIPGITWADPGYGAMPPASKEARLLLLSIALQESGLENIQQGGDGPGRGYFQMEPPTCGLILMNPASRSMAELVCLAASVVADQDGVYGALITKPVQVAVPFARLDLWCDPRPLPAYGDTDAAWEAYAYRDWRPGAVAKGGESAIQARQRWSVNYAAALAADQAYLAGREAVG